MNKCDEYCVDSSTVSNIKKNMKPDETFTELAETFKALGDPGRLKIVASLAEQELCVCELTEITGSSQSSVSHQLRVLRNMRLVKYRREGRSIYYSLDDPHIEQLFNQGMEHVEE